MLGGGGTTFVDKLHSINQRTSFVRGHWLARPLKKTPELAIYHHGKAAVLRYDMPHTAASCNFFKLC